MRTVLLLLTPLGCSDGGLTQHNSGPTAQILSPDDGTLVTAGAEQTLRGAAGDPDHATETLSVLWFVDEVEWCAGGPDLDGITECVFMLPDSAAEALSIRLEVLDPTGAAATDTIMLSTEAAAVNSPPTAPELALTPDEPVAGDTLQCSILTPSSDADGDALVYHFAWTVEGEEVESAGEAALESWVEDVEADQTWSCTVVADDGDLLSDPATVTVTTAPDCDLDGDGFEAEACGGDDCDDAAPEVHPRAGDVYGDDVDADCDGLDCEATSSGDVYLTVCVGTDSISAEDAEQTCIDAGYDGLAIPFDDTENSTIAQLNETLWPLRPLENHNIRLGGTDVEEEGTWRHTRTNALLSYLNWASSEPTNSDGSEHCINMIGALDYSGQWQDLGCSAGSNSDTAFSCEAR